MALAAKLLVGALVLGAGSTATYVAVTGGFGAGGNGTETEAGSEAQAVASPAQSSPGTRVESSRGQGQQEAPAGGVRANDQTPDADSGRGPQEQRGITVEESNTREGQSQEDAVGSGANLPDQGATTVQLQAPMEDSAQSLSASARGTDNESLGGKNAADAVDSSVDTDISGVGNSAAGQTSKQGSEVVDTPDNTLNGDEQKTQEQLAQAQTEGQDGAGGNTSEQTPQAGNNASQGVIASAGTVTAQEPAVTSGTNPDSSN